MSELPNIDPLKVAQRDVAKLNAELADYRARETQLEILAEALRDQRDEAEAGLEELRSQLQLSTANTTEVHDIASLPSEK